MTDQPDQLMHIYDKIVACPDYAELISGVERVLGHEPLQKIDVGLKAPRSLVQAGGFRAVLYSGDILRAPGFNSDDDQAQAQHRNSDHALLSIPIFLPSCSPGPSARSAMPFVRRRPT